MHTKLLTVFILVYITGFFPLAARPLNAGAIDAGNPQSGLFQGRQKVKAEQPAGRQKQAQSVQDTLPMPPPQTNNYFVPTATLTQPVTPAQPSQPQPAPQPVAQAQPVAKKGDVSFNFDDADVFSVIQTIFGDVLRVNYIVDPRVKGRVNFRSVAPVAKEDVLPLMEVILRLNGIGLVEDGGLFRMVPIADLPKEPASVGVGRESEKVLITGKALVQVVPVNYVQSTDLVRVLTPFLSTNALIVDVPKSNHIVITDTDSNVKRLLQLIEIFDSEQLRRIKPHVFVYPVQNSKAKDVAALLQQIFLGAKPSSQPAAPKTTAAPAPGTLPIQLATSFVSAGAGTTGGETLVSDITRIIPDDVTNSIIILSTPEDYALIAETISKIDIVPRQVLIEAIVAEVTLEDNMSFGLQWSLNTDINVSGLRPFKNNINLDGTVTFNPGDVAGSAFTFVSMAGDRIKAQLQALASDSKAKVLSSPHILVSDNREARIQVGDQIPIATSTTTTPLSGSTATTNTTTSTIQYKDTGTILKVKPQVNDSGLVALELSQEVSTATTTTVLGTDQYVISKREVTTNLVVLDAQTIIIGGLIREDANNKRTGLPFLSRIPILGYLFGKTSKDNKRTELIVLLTPHVIRNQVEADSVTSGYVQRLKGVSKDIDIKKEQVILDRGQTGHGKETDGKDSLRESP